MNSQQTDTLRKQETFVILRASGNSYRAIARKIGVSKDTCMRWERSLSERIATEKKERLDALYSQYGMAKEDRIKSLGKLQSKIEREISQRDLSTLPTDKLIDNYLKVREAISKEYTPTQTSETITLEKTVQERLSILASQVATGEISRDELRVEATALLSLQKTRDLIPSENGDQEQTRITFLTPEESLQIKLEEIRAKADIMLSGDQKEFFDQAIAELDEIKKGFHKQLGDQKFIDDLKSQATPNF